MTAMRRARALSSSAAAAKEGSATVEEKKDGRKTLTLEKDGEKFVLNSITASEFKKRKNAGAKPPSFPGLK